MTLTYDFLESAIHVSYSNKRIRTNPHYKKPASFLTEKLKPEQQGLGFNEGE